MTYCVKIEMSRFSTAEEQQRLHVDDSGPVDVLKMRYDSPTSSTDEEDVTAPGFWNQVTHKVSQDPSVSDGTVLAGPQLMDTLIM